MQKLWYTYTEIVSSHKEPLNQGIHRKMNTSGDYYIKQNKQESEKQTPVVCSSYANASYKFA